LSHADDQRSGDPLNYRHEFHAGNFADVFKHVLLARVLLYLARKETAFRYIETHAGRGRYDLSAPEAERTGEWRAGIGRFLAAPAPRELEPLISPYRAIVGASMSGMPPLYPGSPLIAKQLLRRQDRMILCEREPRARAALSAAFGRERPAKTIEMDGFIGLNAFIPPAERRGLVFIDPPFEDKDEFDRLAALIPAAWRKWRSGLYMLWYPVKEARGAQALAQALVASGIAQLLRLELQVDHVKCDGPLARCGLLIVNPPFTLAEEAAMLLPHLARCMGHGGGACFEVEWLARD